MHTISHTPQRVNLFARRGARPQPAPVPAGTASAARCFDRGVPKSVREAFDTTPRTIDFVLPGFKAGTVGLLTSPGGTGKSFVALELAMSVAAAGADASLLDVGLAAHGQVLVINAEDDGDILHQRLHAIGQLLDTEVQERVAQQMSVLSMVGNRPDMLAPDWVQSLRERCEGARLCVIDTLARFHSADENSNGEMSWVLSAFERVAHETGCAILLLHHTAKAAALNGQQSAQQSSRGASAIVDNARWQSYLEGVSEKEAKALGIPAELRRSFVHFGVSKQNYGTPVEPRLLARVDGGVLMNVGTELAAVVHYVKELRADRAGVAR